MRELPTYRDLLHTLTNETLRRKLFERGYYHALVDDDKRPTFTQVELNELTQQDSTIQRDIAFLDWFTGKSSTGSLDQRIHAETRIQWLELELAHTEYLLWEDKQKFDIFNQYSKDIPLW